MLGKRAGAEFSDVDHAGALVSAGAAGDAADHRNRISGPDDLAARFIADHIRGLCDGVVLVFCPWVHSVVLDRPRYRKVSARFISPITF